MPSLEEIRNKIIPDKPFYKRANDLEFYEGLFNSSLEDFYRYNNSNGWIGDIMTYHQAETIERIEIIKMKHC